MPNKPQIGPDVRTSYSCHGCTFCTSKSYRVQSDSGFDIFCNHGGKKRDIGNGSWHMPEWCPVKPIDERAPVPELQGSFPLILYFATDKDRGEFLDLAKVALPNLITRNL